MSKQERGPVRLGIREILPSCFKLLSYVWENDKGSILITAAAAIFWSLQEIAFILLPKFFVDALLASDMRRGAQVLAMYAAVVTVFALAVSVIGYYVSLFRMRRKYSIAQQVMFRTLEVDLDYIDDGPFMDRNNRIVNNIQTATDSVVSVLGALLSATIKAFAVVTILSSVSSWLLALLVIVILVDIGLSVAASNYEYGSTVAQEKEEKRLSTLARIFVLPNSIREIKTLLYDRAIRDKYTEVKNNTIATKRRFQKSIARVGFVQGVVSELNPVVPMSYFGYCVVQGVIDISSYFMYNNAYASLKNSVKAVLGVIPHIYTTGLYSHDYFEFMEDDKITTSTNRSGKTLESIESIELDNVSFRYLGSSQHVLNNVSFRIGKGEKVALVGVNGAGKTTIVKILMGLYAPTTGRVLINGVDIRSYSTASLRRQFAVLFQDYYLFPFTIRENIFADGAEDAEIAELLNRFGVWDRIRSLKRGLDTGLSAQFYDDHTNLSGGERQKIAITRLLMQKRAGCLILDEPASNLDPMSEYVLYQKVLSEIPSDKTVLVISHRLTMTTKMDRIIVIDRGSVAESGTHNELLALGGIYAEMFSVQAEKYAM